MTPSLTFTHLRFDCRARDAIFMNGHRAGNFLRGALGRAMLTAVCPLTPRPPKPTPAHAAVCPACWLLAHETTPGRVQRAYALVPPLPPREIVPAGGRFSFCLTLFGEEGFRFLPYLVLAVPEMGRVGLGRGRGRFALEAIWAVNPLAGQAVQMLAPGTNLVRVPDHPVRWADVEAAVARFHPALGENTPLEIRFLTPMRLIEAEHLAKVPDFAVLFRRLLMRIDELGGQFAGQERRPPEEVQRLHTLADQVRLVEMDVHWVELKSSSTRRGQEAPMSGFAGRALYRSADWEALLPWLVWGQGVQAGKYAVKGHGVFEVGLPGSESYWQLVVNPGENHADHPKSDCR